MVEYVFFNRKQTSSDDGGSVFSQADLVAEMRKNYRPGI